MRFLCNATLVFVLAGCLFPSVNATAQQFPHLQEDNLAGRQVTLPDATSGRVSVLVLGFSHASGTPTGAWAKRIQSDFGRSPGFALYQLAVLEAAPRMIRGMIVSSIKKGVPTSQHANFLIVVHQEAELQKLVGYKEADDAYIVVLDRDGKVVYQTHGSSVDPAYTEFRGKLQPLLK
jgi:hypothetical protein